MTYKQLMNKRKALLGLVTIYSTALDTTLDKTKRKKLWKLHEEASNNLRKLENEIASKY